MPPHRKFTLIFRCWSFIRCQAWCRKWGNVGFLFAKTSKFVSKNLAICAFGDTRLRNVTAKCLQFDCYYSIDRNGLSTSRIGQHSSNFEHNRTSCYRRSAFDHCWLAHVSFTLFLKFSSIQNIPEEMQNGDDYYCFSNSSYMLDLLPCFWRPRDHKEGKRAILKFPFADTSCRHCSLPIRLSHPSLTVLPNNNNTSSFIAAELRRRYLLTRIPYDIDSSSFLRIWEQRPLDLDSDDDLNSFPPQGSKFELELC